MSCCLFPVSFRSCRLKTRERSLICDFFHHISIVNIFVAILRPNLPLHFYLHLKRDVSTSWSIRQSSSLLRTSIDRLSYLPCSFLLCLVRISLLAICMRHVLHRLLVTLLVLIRILSLIPIRRSHLGVYVCPAVLLSWRFRSFLTPFYHFSFIAQRFFFITDCLLIVARFSW
jgi:hypothetical protein